MVNMLATAFRRIISRRDRTGPFLVGFEIGGTLAILAYLGCFRWWPEQMEAVFVTVRWPIELFCDAYAPRCVSARFYQADWVEYPVYLKSPM
jgi:hypothetical protein